MILADEKSVGLWYLVLASNLDFMAYLRELEPDSTYQFTYRFRYCKDGKIFDSKDEKRFDAEVQGTRCYCIACTRHLCEHLRQMEPETASPICEILNDHGFSQFTKDLQDAPFVFTRLASKEEIQEYEQESGK